MHDEEDIMWITGMVVCLHPAVQVQYLLAQAVDTCVHC